MSNLKFGSHWPYFLLIFCALILAFLPVITEVYVFHDDLSFWMYPPPHQPHPQSDLLLYSGRYLGAFVYNFYSYFVTTLTDLNKIRFISLLVLLIASLGCYKLIFHYLKQPLNAALVVIALFSLPAFEVMTDWASGAFHPFAIAFSVLAILMANQIPTQGGLKSRLFNPSSLLAVAFMLISHLFYPPAATFYWPMAAIIFMAESKQDPISRKAKLVNIYAAGLMAIGLYAVLLKLVGFFFKFSIKSAYEPQSIVSDVSGKLIWFYKTFVTQIMNLWNIFPGTTIPLIIVLLILGAFIIKIIQKTPVTITPILIIISLVILSYLPNLLTVVNLNVYRCTAGIMSLLLLGIVWAIKTWCDLLPVTMKGKILSIVLCFMAIYGLVNCYNNINNYRVKLSRLEFNFVKDAIVNFKSKPEWIIVTPPHADDFYHYYDEFGGLTAIWPEDIISLINCVFNELANEENMKWVDFKYDSKTHQLHYVFKDKSTSAYHTVDVRVVLSDTPPQELPPAAISLNFKSLYPDIQKIMGRHFDFKSSL